MADLSPSDVVRTALAAAGSAGRLAPVLPLRRPAVPDGPGPDRPQAA